MFKSYLKLHARIIDDINVRMYDHVGCIGLTGETMQHTVPR